MVPRFSEYTVIQFGTKVIFVKYVAGYRLFCSIILTIAYKDTHDNLSNIMYLGYQMAVRWTHYIWANIIGAKWTKTYYVVYEMCPVLVCCDLMD